jgi:hypothetical protein
MLQDAAEGRLPIPIFNKDENFDWQLTASTGREVYDDVSNLWLPSSAEHTLKLFGVEP